METTRNSWQRALTLGGGAASTLLLFFFALLSVISGWVETIRQFSSYWPFLLSLAAGFGLQVSLFIRLRDIARHQSGGGAVVAVSGGTSTAAMISCCTHYLVNVLPVIGATGFVALVAQYQIELFWVGIAFNLAGLAYIGRKLMLASRHMKEMMSS